jgi:ribosomal protein S18 acetylase RimI-like enzyme
MDASPEITLGPGGPEHAEAFRECLDAVARERRWLMYLRAPALQEVQAFLKGRSPIQFLARQGEEVVGWCDITPDPREGFRHSGVLGMGVLAEYRGRGIGRRLLDRTVREARAAGLTRIELEVFSSNQAAISLYQEFGFREEGRKRGARVLDGREEDILLMAVLGS